MLKRTSLILLFLVPIVSLFTYTEAGAVANGNGICDATEAANYDCGQFGPNVIEFLGASSSTCALYGGGFAPCTVYSYKYTGGTTNQVIVAIPMNLTQVLNDEYEVHCSQYITNGSGDPTTGFGKGFYTFGICRLPPNMGPSVTFTIATDPSFIDKTVPLNWQVRQSKTEVYTDSIVGPVTAQAPVAETGATIMTKEGTLCTYRIQAGQVVLTVTDCPTGSVEPITKLCLPTVQSQPITFTKDGVNWTCETISFVTEQCDVKTTGGDPCRYIGGVCIRY